MVIQSQQSRFPPFSHKFPYVDLRVLTRHQMSVKATFAIREVSGPFLPEDSLTATPPNHSVTSSADKACYIIGKSQHKIKLWDLLFKNQGEVSVKVLQYKTFSFFPQSLSLSMSWWVLFAIWWCSLLGMGALIGQVQTFTGTQGSSVTLHVWPTSCQDLFPGSHQVPCHSQGQGSHLPFSWLYCSNPWWTGNYQGTTTSMPGGMQYVNRR